MSLIYMIYKESYSKWSLKIGLGIKIPINSA